MDEADLFIIKRMTEDGRVSFRKIAKELGLSTDTIINRFKMLQEKGIIRGSTVVIDPKKIGYQGMAAFIINASPTHILGRESNPSELTQILHKLITMKNIILATKTVGDHDALAVCVVRDLEHLIAIGNEIAKIPGVNESRVSFWAEKAELCPKYFII